ncbi:MAG TPA: hypothetical protein VFZ10_13900 [Geminicoccaceae bacterium]
MSEETDREVRRVDRRRMRLAQIILMALGAFLLGAHVFKWDAVQVDAVTLTLLGLLLLLPFADLIRKIKLGEFEAEIGRDEVARAQAKVAVELPSLPRRMPRPLRSVSESCFVRIQGWLLQKYA